MSSCRFLRPLMHLRPAIWGAVIASVLLAAAALPCIVRARDAAEVRQDTTVYLPVIMRVIPGPKTVQVVLDPSHRVTQAVTPSGGVVTLAGPGGVQLSLTIPDGALMVTRTITMTLVGGIPDLPFSGGLAAGVQLEPSGLTLLEPAVLDIQAGTPVPPDRQAFFAYDEAGADFRLHPPYWDRANLSRTAVLVSHFSGYGMASGTQAERAAMLNYPPSSYLEGISQEIAELVESQRGAELAGQPGDPQFRSKLEALQRRWYTDFIAPTLQAAQQTMCKGRAGQQALDRAISQAVDWRISADLLGFDENFMSAERENVETAGLSALYLCWLDATTPCLDWNNPGQVQRVFALARKAQFISPTPEYYDPYKVRACVDCEWVKAVTDWAGSVSFAYRESSSRTEYGTTTTANVSRAASMSFGMVRGATWGGRERWGGSETGGASGSGKIDDKTGESTQYGSWTMTWVSTSGIVDPSYAKLSIDATACNYSVEFHPFLTVIYNNNGSVSPPRTDTAGTPYLFQLPIPTTTLGRAVSGSQGLPVESSGASENTYTHFLLGPNAASAELEFALGNGNLGSTLLTWSFRPAWFWGDP